MTNRTFSIWVMVVTVLAFVGVDVWLALNSTSGDTYSEIIRQLWWQAPVVGFGFVVFFGVLSGHWFKPKPGSRRRPRWIIFFAGLAAVVTFFAFLAGAFWW